MRIKCSHRGHFLARTNVVALKHIRFVDLNLFNSYYFLLHVCMCFMQEFPRFSWKKLVGMKLFSLYAIVRTSRKGGWGKIKDQSSCNFCIYVFLIFLTIFLEIESKKTNVLFPFTDSTTGSRPIFNQRHRKGENSANTFRRGSKFHWTHKFFSYREHQCACNQFF